MGYQEISSYNRDKELKIQLIDSQSGMHSGANLQER